MMWNSNGHWDSGDWAMLALVVIAAVAVVVAIVFLVRYLSRTEGASSARTVSPTPPSGPESPKDILKRRYAAGEFTATSTFACSATSSVARSHRRDLVIVALALAVAALAIVGALDAALPGQWLFRLAWRGDLPVRDRCERRPHPAHLERYRRHGRRRDDGRRA